MLEKWRYSVWRYRFIGKITFMPFISFLCSARVQPPKAILKLQGDVGNTFTSIPSHVSIIRCDSTVNKRKEISIMFTYICRLNRYSEQNDTLLYIHDKGAHIKRNNYYNYNRGLSYNNSKLF